ncbi:hypothetical protein D9M71_361210 [compost metagenome]
MQGLRVADFEDGLQSCRQVAAIMVQNLRARSELRAPGRGLAVGTEVVIETPAANLLAQVQYFWRGAQVADLIEQAVMARYVLRQHVPLAPLARTNHRPLAVHQLAGRAVQGAGPDAFLLDFRVQGELGSARLRQTKGDGVAEILATEAQAQALEALAWATLDCYLTCAHAPADGLWPGPERRFQPAFTRQCIDHATLGGFCEQAQCLVQVGLAAAVGAGNDIQALQGHDQLVDGAVIGDRQGREHVASLRRSGIGRVTKYKWQTFVWG